MTKQEALVFSVVMMATGLIGIMALSRWERRNGFPSWYINGSNAIVFIAVLVTLIVFFGVLDGATLLDKIIVGE